MKIYPKISIITPVYNRVGMLEQTMRSVLCQQYPALQYIIIDGGSTDGTTDLIKKYAEKAEKGDFGKVDFQWISEKDNGMYDAIMKGIRLATGEVVAWINSDDMYHIGALKIVGQIFGELRDVKWITGTPTLYNAEGLCVKTFPTVYWSWVRFRRGDFRWLQQESTFFRKSLFDEVGGLNLDYQLAADFELWCKMFQKANLYSVNTVLAGFRQHGDQLSVLGVNKYEKEVRQICQVYKMRYKCDPYVARLQSKLMKKNKIEYNFEQNCWKI